MKFNLKEGTTFIMGHMVNCVFDYKVDVATTTQYRVNIQLHHLQGTLWKRESC
jgi:hypothetical protein